MSEFVSEVAVPSFSFCYGGKKSAEFLSSWRREETWSGEDPEKRLRRSHTDADTGLRVTLDLRRFADFPAVEWVLTLQNTGSVDTPILEDIQPLDVTAALPAAERLRLHWANGSLCQADDFLPQESELRPGQRKTLAPRGGRPSNGVLPFMNLQRDGCGMVLAIGWSGQWAATLAREKESLRLTAGMERTHLVLHPGEKIRTPRILLLRWSGTDPLAGQNLFRRLLLAHYLPRLDGQTVLPVSASCLQAYFYQTDQAGEELELKVLPRAAALGLDTYWIDACWYGRSGRQWWEEVGSWQVNRERFPRGLKVISDAAHAAGLKFLLWFEPERVRKDSLLAVEHPEFLLRHEKSTDTFLLNLGQPEARRYITDAISRLITENGVDIYRQDFNFDPLPYWREADAPDRAGMTEIRYVEGHYEFWDELRRRHAGLWIDNCASGGRRLDLETLSRSLPLWPSDFQDVVGLPSGMGLHVGEQCISAGLARWIPLFGGGVWNFTPYGFRSRMSAGFAMQYHIAEKDYPPEDSGQAANYKDLLAKGRKLLDDDFPFEMARQAVAEWKTLRPFMLGDFYPLLPLTISPHDWCAYQFHREDLGAGFALIFRRHASPFPKMELRLRGLDPKASYDVSLSPDYQEAPRTRMSGRKLARLSVSLRQKPGSLLLRYGPASGKW